VKVQKEVERVVGVDDVVLLLSGAAAAAQLVDYGIKVGKVIIEWRRKLKEKGIEAKGKLEKPEQAPLDLSKATDEEIKEWLSQNKKQ
jgi:transposase